MSNSTRTDKNTQRSYHSNLLRQTFLPPIPPILPQAPKY